MLMRPLFFALFLLLLFVGDLHTQPNPHLQARLWRANNDLLARLHSTPADSLSLLKAEGIALCRRSDSGAELRQWQTENAHSSRIKWCIGQYCAVEIPLNEIPKWANAAPILRIEAQRAPMQRLSFPDDTLLLYHNRLSEVHTGTQDLPFALRGRGVLLSVIDDGFDWRHPDFQHEDSTTRVRYIWDQGLQSTWGETEIGYGSIWDSTAIQDGFVQQAPAAHGSHVAGIAAGNARAAGKHRGAAPESSLLWVKVAEGNGSFLPRFADAIYWSALRSRQLGMPCSINSSVGSYVGSHDGKDLHTRAINTVLDSFAGVVLSQAAGNARASRFHLRTNLQSSADTARIWFQPLAAQGLTQFIFYADSANAQELRFSLENIDANSLFIKAQTPVFQLLADFPAPNGSSNLYQQTLYHLPNGQAVRMNVYISNYEGVYECWIQIQSPNTQDYWQFTSSGRSQIDLWSASALTGTSNMLLAPPRPVDYYHAPDSLQSIVGFWNCSESVISVGSYQNQTFMINYAGDSLYLGTQGFPQGGISQFSSLGGTRDGRMKPDICASGGQVLSAAPVPDLMVFRMNGMVNLDAGGWHVTNRGTSMSAPIVAGAVALYLQCSPQSNAAQVLAAVRATARVDSLVFAQSPTYPNIHWGWGKLDAYNLALSCLRRGCMDTLAINFDEWATLSDTNACLYTPLSMGEDLAYTEGWRLLPNPAGGENCQIWAPEKLVSAAATVSVYDLCGRVCGEGVFVDRQAILSLQNLAAGLYMCSVFDAQGQRLHTLRLIRH